MGKVANYKDLIAWQKAMDLVEAIYRITSHLPADERFGLTAQLRRAAVGVPCNIAEGFGRYGRADYLRFLDMALGSINEVETQLLISRRLGFLTEVQIVSPIDSINELQRIIKGLIRSLRGITKDNIRAT